MNIFVIVQMTQNTGLGKTLMQNYELEFMDYLPIPVCQTLKMNAKFKNLPDQQNLEVSMFCTK